jgi:hypothetical protein
MNQSIKAVACIRKNKGWQADWQIGIERERERERERDRKR